MTRLPVVKTQGLTLIELVVLLLLLSILAVTAVLRLPGTLLNIEPVAREFASDIRYTQNLAMSRGQLFYLSIDSSTTYSIHNAEGQVQTHPYTQGTTMTLGNNLTFSTITGLPNQVIAFNTRGKPSIDTSGSTILSSTASVCFQSAGEKLCVSISPTTGFVSVS